MLDDDDIEEFVSGLKQAGLLGGGGDAVATTPSSRGGVMMTSNSAPVVLASAGVAGKYRNCAFYVCLVFYDLIQFVSYI